MKKLHKLILTSQTYQQSARYTQRQPRKMRIIDLLWRYSPMRLPAKLYVMRCLPSAGR